MADAQDADLRGLTDTHEEYDAFEERVARCRHCVDGVDAIKEATTAYFPALAGEVPLLTSQLTTTRPVADTPLAGQYEKRIALAAVYEAADKTLDALLGALYRTPSQPTIPDVLVPHLLNIDLAGTGYDAFKHQAGAEVLEVGRYGVLVDWSAEQRRPFWRPYETEQIDNWVYGIRGGQKVLEMVKLRESVTERSSSGFGGETAQRYRVVELDASGVVMATTYTRRTRVSDNGGMTRIWDVEGPVPLARQGVALTEIPFVCFGRLDLDLCPQKPPLLGICDLQLDHYRLDGDVKWAVHVGCMGGLFVIGDGDPDTPKAYYMGGAVNRLAADASVQFVTLPADMVDRARQEKADDERRMALMGARMLLAPKREAETAEAALIQRDGESASLSMLSHAISAALTKCWQHHATWMGLPTDGVGDELSRDFFPHRLTPEEITAQLALVQAGKMSTETFLENLYAGEITREPEVEMERLAAEPPAADPGNPADLGLDPQQTGPAAA